MVALKVAAEVPSNHHFALWRLFVFDLPGLVLLLLLRFIFLFFYFFDKPEALASPRGAVLTDGLHHAGLSGVRLHWDDVLETVQGDDSLSGGPNLKDVLHFGAQLLENGKKGMQFAKCYTSDKKS